MKTNFKTNRKQISGTILKSMIVALVFIVSATVNGQDFWTTTGNSIFSTTSLISENYGSSIATAEFNGFSAMNNIEYEKPLELENWMVTEETFGTFLEVNQETDNSLKLEPWMTNEKFFTVDYHGEKEPEEGLQLEEWMKNENHFQVTKIEEKPLELEPWMIASNFGSK